MENKKPKTILILSTVGKRADATKIARTLVDEKLAACVNIVGPIRSVYRWQGSVTTDSEYLMLIKTRQTLYSLLERRLREIHPYEVPEIIAFQLLKGAKSYVQWLLESTA